MKQISYLGYIEKVSNPKMFVRITNELINSVKNSFIAPQEDWDRKFSQREITVSRVFSVWYYYTHHRYLGTKDLKGLIVMKNIKMVVFR